MPFVTDPFFLLVIDLLSGADLYWGQLLDLASGRGSNADAGIREGDADRSIFLRWLHVCVHICLFKKLRPIRPGVCEAVGVECVDCWMFR